MTVTKLAILPLSYPTHPATIGLYPHPIPAMTPNRVTLPQLEALIDSADSQEHVFWDKELVVSYRLPSGFTVTGRGACVDPANFEIELGRKCAREDAINQLWPLEGYVLQNELHRKGVL